MIAALLLALASSSPASEPLVGSVVRSKQYVIHRGASKSEELIGDVRYEAGGKRMTSDWALFSHADRSWKARGSVRLRRESEDGVVFEAAGEKAGHEQDSGRGFLEPAAGGRVSFSRRPPGVEADFGTSGRVSWNGEQRVTMSAGARVWGPRLELAADEAVYEKKDGRLTLNGGRPVLRKVEGEWTTALKADTITATEVPRRVEARGKVVGWMIFKDEKKLKEFAK
ncbi:MAG: hypothetical protein M0D55_10005 [Elusimicrobiota bacterium]|nr:MAG: hypothetical protein M0D55_10005 [Elusimicrobiota bacterium]